MAADPPTAVQITEENRRWEDYTSLKQHFKHDRIKEIRFIGHQLSTAAAAEVNGVSATIAFLGANDIVYVKSQADLAALDGDSIYLDYCSSTGVIYEGVESKLDSVTSTATEVPIGCESGTYVDTVAAVDGYTLTMTNLDLSSATANGLAGWYVVGSGDATHQEGAYLTISSNTAANPTVITCTTEPNANWADDNVSVQETLNNDVYRIRRMYAETESPADNEQYICDKDETNIYGIIPDTQTHGHAGSRWFAPASTTRTFLGRVICKVSELLEGDATAGGMYLTVTYTPKAESTNTSAADTTVVMSFMEDLDWQPCIELEPATDVIFRIHKLVDADHVTVFFERTILEVTPRS